MSQPNSTHTPQLVTRDGAVIPDGWTLLADDDTTGADGPFILSFERALRELDGRNGHYGVRVLPADDVRLLEPFLEKITLIEVAFPGYRDGRGYSTARILREDFGYTGIVRAVGDVLRDQLFYMLRCGFDEFVVKDKDPSQAITSAAQRFQTVYQGAADSNRPAWAKRHTLA
ncbi:hypothetical protein ABAC460_02380 [Asticcacaulis sp. AC460]|uniref:DUF934 domain-containing protein n=1 Tax=Asticcacaulis sp. AC460 TaxID=1282360 RepID=UPI0003C3B176|nr:DUF934 domain-containing protein [Asticcacaulis sp. AC460]ESQ92695.1 hypothetical protein ABAC460_02380 [Asticcacaulis sp. AC460]